jgi:hypothetical protein
MPASQNAAAAGVVLRPNPAAAQTPQSVNAHPDHSAEVLASWDRISAAVQTAVERCLMNGHKNEAR